MNQFELLLTLIPVGPKFRPLHVVTSFQLDMLQILYIIPMQKSKIFTEKTYLIISRVIFFSQFDKISYIVQLHQTNLIYFYLNEKIPRLHI